MSMGITGTTTFSEIYQQRTTEGGSLQDVEGGKHLRFKDDNLYTHDSGKSHGLNFIERAKKHQEAVKTVKASIDRELGPGIGDYLFKQLGLSSKKITVDQLQLLHGEVEFLKKTTPFVPNGMTLNLTQSGAYDGHLELTWPPEAINELKEDINNPKNSERWTNHGNDKPTDPPRSVCTQFMRDVIGSTIRLHDGPPPKSEQEQHDEESLRSLHNNLTELGLSDEPPIPPKEPVPSKTLKSDTAEQDLKGFSGGDDEVCLNLSRLIRQDQLIGMTYHLRGGLKNENGDTVEILLDQHHPELIKQHIDVYKDGDDFVITYHRSSPVTGVRQNETGEMVSFKPGGGQTTEQTMELRISREDLKSGKWQEGYHLTGPTGTVTLSFSVEDQWF